MTPMKCLAGYCGLFLLWTMIAMIPTRVQTMIVMGIPLAAAPVGVAYVVGSEFRRDRRQRKNAEWAERARQEWMV